MSDTGVGMTCLTYLLCVFQFEIEAVDDRAVTIQRVARATVVISVLRDSGPPVFTNTPYVAGVPITQAVNTTVFTVRAVDPDLRVSAPQPKRARECLCVCVGGWGVGGGGG